MKYLIVLMAVSLSSCTAFELRDSSSCIVECKVCEGLKVHCKDGDKEVVITVEEIKSG